MYCNEYALQTSKLCTTYQFQKNLSNQINRCGPTLHAYVQLSRSGRCSSQQKSKFFIKYASLDNLICYVCQNFANPETAAVSAVWPA